MVKIGLDIGGTLIKVALEYTESEEAKVLKTIGEVKHDVLTSQGNKYAFFILERSQIAEFFALMNRIRQNLDLKYFGSTGGGAFYFKQEFESQGFVPETHPEFQGLLKGVLAWSNAFPESVYTFQKSAKSTITLDEIRPFILVNIGSGCSVNYFSETAQLLHVAGTSFGGSTILGFARKMFQINEFNSILELFKEYLDEHPNCLDDPLPPSISLLNAEYEGVKLGDREVMKQQITATILHFIENICSIAYFCAKSKKAVNILFIGYSISDAEIFHPLLDHKIQQYSQMNKYEVRVC